MFAGNCPTKGRLLLGLESVRALFTIEQGVIVMCWECPCGQDHLTPFGRRVQADPNTASAATRAAREYLSSQPSSAVAGAHLRPVGDDTSEHS